MFWPHNSSKTEFSFTIGVISISVSKQTFNLSPACASDSNEEDESPDESEDNAGEEDSTLDDENQGKTLV